MIIEPGKQEKKLAAYLDEGTFKKVLIVSWHGLGDQVMFLPLFDKLKELYPGIHFDLGFCKGLDEETIYPEAILLGDLKNIEEGYDLTALIHFPVEVPGLTKAELCCKEELGISPPAIEYKPLPKFPSKLCAVHWNITCLPDLANCPEDVAKKIWSEILAAGWIPIESHFEHIFHNPVNQKFDFVDCSVRRVTPRVSTLLGLLGACGAFIGVVSGNFHCAMATMPHERIAFLQREIPVERFTHEKIQTFDLKNYQDGGVRDWLKNLDS
jgi:hypothetical protein